MKILCAEALWDNDISQNKTTYKSILNLVRNETGSTVAYFTFNTEEELRYIFEIFHKKKYDILYIASHMKDGKVISGLGGKFEIDYFKLIDEFKDTLKNKVIHLAGCSSLNNVEPSKIMSLFRDCGLKVLSGYLIDTDTTQSSAIEILYLTELINYGIIEFLNSAQKHYQGLFRVTGMEIFYLPYTEKETND